MDSDLLTCPHCGTTFPDSKALDWHMESNHGVDRKSSGDIPASTENRQASAACPACGQHFPNELLLNWHFETAHQSNAGRASPSTADDGDHRKSNRLIARVVYSILVLVFIVGWIGFHWNGGFVLAAIIGAIVIYFITAHLDEREADWKERTRENYQRNYQTPPVYHQPQIGPKIGLLSEGQKALIPRFIEKWRRVELETGPADRTAGENSLKSIYGSLGLAAPRIVWCASPLAAALASKISQRVVIVGTDAYPWNQTREKVTVQANQDFWEMVARNVAAGSNSGAGESLAALIRRENPPIHALFYSIREGESSWDVAGRIVRSAVGEENWDAVLESFYTGSGGFPQLGAFVAAEIERTAKVTKAENKQDESRAAATDFAYTGEIDVEDVSSPDVTMFRREKVKARVRYTVGDRAQDSIGNSVKAAIRHACYGQDDAPFLALIDYFRSACDLGDETAGLKGQWEQAQSAGWYLPYKYTCWVCERHNILHLNERGLLHCENGLALGYPDGWGIYALNGVPMKPEDVLTPAAQLDPLAILREPNVDVRRELLRKIGIARMLKFGKEVDRLGDYRLIDMSPIFKDAGIRYAPFLLMESASALGAQHLEGVSPECRTVQQAINWRASEVAKEWTPDLLS